MCPFSGTYAPCFWDRVSPWPIIHEVSLLTYDPQGLPVSASSALEASCLAFLTWVLEIQTQIFTYREQTKPSPYQNYDSLDNNSAKTGEQRCDQQRKHHQAIIPIHRNEEERKEQIERSVSEIDPKLRGWGEGISSSRPAWATKRLSAINTENKGIGTGEMDQWLKGLNSSRGPVCSLAPTWQLKSLCNSSPGGSNTLFQPPWGTVCTLCTDIYQTKTNNIHK